jgi:hypothetical protein
MERSTKRVNHPTALGIFQDLAAIGRMPSRPGLTPSNASVNLCKHCRISAFLWAILTSRPLAGNSRDSPFALCNLPIPSESKRFLHKWLGSEGNERCQLPRLFSSFAGFGGRWPTAQGQRTRAIPTALIRTSSSTSEKAGIDPLCRLLQGRLLSD